MSGNESLTVIETGKNSAGEYQRTTTGGGSYTLTASGAGLSNGTGSTGYTLTETGNPLSGDFSQTETGTTRYDLLEGFNNVADTNGNSTPGHLNFVPYGVAFVDPFEQKTRLPVALEPKAFYTNDDQLYYWDRTDQLIHYERGPRGPVIPDMECEELRKWIIATAISINNRMVDIKNSGGKDRENHLKTLAQNEFILLAQFIEQYLKKPCKCDPLPQELIPNRAIEQVPQLRNAIRQGQLVLKPKQETPVEPPKTAFFGRVPNPECHFLGRVPSPEPESDSKVPNADNQIPAGPVGPPLLPQQEIPKTPRPPAEQTGGSGVLDGIGRILGSAARAAGMLFVFPNIDLFEPPKKYRRPGDDNRA